MINSLTWEQRYVFYLRLIIRSLICDQWPTQQCDISALILVVCHVCAPLPALGVMGSAQASLVFLIGPVQLQWAQSVVLAQRQAKVNQTDGNTVQAEQQIRVQHQA